NTEQIALAIERSLSVRMVRSVVKHVSDRTYNLEIYENSEIDDKIAFEQYTKLTELEADDENYVMKDVLREHEIISEMLNKKRGHDIDNAVEIEYINGECDP
ncbi:30956_t:CDS:2, partial [Racocetra persica]